MRVVVKDKTGYTTPSTAVNATTKQSGLSEEVLASNIGKYVDYTPISGTFSDHMNSTYNGYKGSPANIQTSTINSLKWKILDISNNKLTLISETIANTNFGIGDAMGYNNGVLLLNNACKAMYSNETLGAVGRSLNIDDIERHMTYDKTTYQNYGQEDYPSNRIYPIIFEYEINAAPNGVYGNKYGPSDQDSYITGTATAIGSADFKTITTYYEFDMSTSTMDNQIYVDLLSSSSKTWLASRCFYSDRFTVHYHFRWISKNSVGSQNFSFSNSYNGNWWSYAIRPVVEIDLTKANVGITGDGGENTPYSIEAK